MSQYTNNTIHTDPQTIAVNTKNEKVTKGSNDKNTRQHIKIVPTAFRKNTECDVQHQMNTYKEEGGKKRGVVKALRNPSGRQI